jgi:DNA (cytosine-5)-methyltransferase 1
VREIIIDSFAGGGGASVGIEAALGRSPDVAIDHDARALAMHEANHPDTLHLCKSVWDVTPHEVAQGRPVGLLWASPDCTHFSKARGGKPASQGIRDLAWVVTDYAEQVRPRVIVLENVQEFLTWGPLGEDHRPVKAQQGETYNLWLSRLRSLGYRVESRILRACDYGAPTIRKRLFVIARCDGRPIVWPEPTHADPALGTGLLPWRTAADVIDWSIPCPLIFERRRPLAENTLKRIFRGLQRFVIDNPEPFIVTYYGPRRDGEFRGCGMAEPIPTQTAENRHALVVPTLVNTANSKTTGRGPNTWKAESPLRTITSSPGFAVVAAHLAKHYGGVTDPITTKDRVGLVTVHGEPYRITDIGLRMLSPRELFRAQGFPDSYIIDLEANGRPLSKADQVRMCGNSVCPPVAAALVEANCADMAVGVRQQEVVG